VASESRKAAIINVCLAEKMTSEGKIEKSELQGDGDRLYL